MIIWRRLGFVIALIGIGSLVVTEKIINGIMNQGNYYGDHGWPKALGLAIAAALSYLFGLISPETSKTYIDKQTRKEVELISGDSLFFIRSRYWPFIFLGIGLVCLAYNFLKTGYL